MNDELKSVDHALTAIIHNRRSLNLTIVSKTNDTTESIYVRVKEGEEQEGGDNNKIKDDVITMDGIYGRDLIMDDGSKFQERLIEVNKETKVLSYHFIGMPLDIPLVGTWRVREVSAAAGEEGENNDKKKKAELEVEDTINLNYWPPTFLMYPIFSFMIPKTADGMLNDCKHYIETGKPSPSKEEALEKKKKADAAAESSSSE